MDPYPTYIPSPTKSSWCWSGFCSVWQTDQQAMSLFGQDFMVDGCWSRSPMHLLHRRLVVTASSSFAGNLLLLLEPSGDNSSVYACLPHGEPPHSVFAAIPPMAVRILWTLWTRDCWYMPDIEIKVKTWNSLQKLLQTKRPQTLFRIEKKKR